MKVTLENTTKIVELTVNGQKIPARIWEGVTENGVKCHAFITRIAVHEADEAGEFERDLEEQKPSSVTVQNIPLHKAQFPTTVRISCI